MTDINPDLSSHVEMVYLLSNRKPDTTEDGLTKVETTFDGDTVWLSIDQMAELFQRDKSTISRHIKIYLQKVNYSGIQLLQNLQQLLLMEKFTM